jgi:Zn-dependent alcohol dehydrogenase
MKIDQNNPDDFTKERVKLDELISEIVPMDNINEGCNKVKNGKAIRIVVTPNSNP